MFRDSVVTLMVDDLARSSAFYRDALGFRSSGPGPEPEQFEVAGLKLRLHRRRPEVDPTGSGTAAIGLEVDDLQTAIRSLSERGVRVGRVLPAGPRRIALFDDPDGNHWYLFDTAARPRDAGARP